MRALEIAVALLVLEGQGGGGAVGQATPLPLPPSSEQLIVVTTTGWDSIGGTLTIYERAPGGAWKQHETPWAIVVGRTGLAWGRGIAPVEGFAGPVKHEGDGRSPAGVFTLGTAFGYAPPDSARWLRLPYVQATTAFECVDDAKSRWYNQLLLRSSARPAPDWSSSEIMRLPGDEYRWGVVVEHNDSPAVPGGGSCIFLHIWDGPRAPTVGCTAMMEQDLIGLMRWLDPKRKPLLVQLPREEYQRLREKWSLP
jgi:D-alanyl-D-alanine dipeptidase